LEESGYNLLDSDEALKESLHVFGAGWAEDMLRDQGSVLASPRLLSLAEEANSHPPQLRTHDRYGHRVDQVRGSCPSIAKMGFDAFSFKRRDASVGSGCSYSNE
jgi:hypothetical protein